MHRRNYATSPGLRPLLVGSILRGAGVAVALLIAGCGGGGGGSSSSAPYVGRSYYFSSGSRSLSISVDAAGRFTIMAKDSTALPDGKAAQGVVSSGGVFTAQSSDGAVQFDGTFGSGGSTLSCTLRSAGGTLFTADASLVAAGTATPTSLLGSYMSTDSSVPAWLTLDSFSHATVWVQCAAGTGGGLASVASDGSLVTTDGLFEARLSVGASPAELTVTRLNGTAVSVVAPLQTSIRAKWTFMVYLNAANNLQSYGPLNVNQMERVGSTADVNIVVQWKQAQCSSCGSPEWSSTRRYYITRDGDTSRVTSPLIEDLGPNVDMGDWRKLYAFIVWAQQTYPADHYALVVWDHGAGWRNTRAATPPAVRSVSIDDSTGSEIQTWELPQALNAATKLDLLIFDASLMQMAEVAYEVRNSAGIMVGSEESPPGEGYVYDTFLRDLTTTPSMTPSAFAQSIVNRTIESYGTTSNITQSAIDLSQMQGVADKIDTFARQMMLYSGTYRSALTSARNNAEAYLYRDNKDLWHYAELVRTATVPSSMQSAARGVQQAIENAVIAQQHGSLHPNSHGIAVYVPDPASYLQTYANLALARATQWDEWLRSQPTN